MYVRGIMEGFYQWLKLILGYRIIMMVVSELAAGEKNRRFVNMFAGMILILIIVKPVFALTDMESLLESGIMERLFEKEYKQPDISLGEAEELRKQALLEEYTKIIRKKITGFVEEEGLVADTVLVEYEFSGDELKIARIHVVAARKYDRDETVKKAYDQALNHTASIEEINIKNSIKNFYMIDMDNIIYEER